MSTDNDAAPRLTPTQRLHEVTLAALQRTTPKASEEVEVTRNAKGDWQFTVAGTAAEDETLSDTAERVLRIARALEGELPLSRKQEYDRKYVAGEK